jgi:hypothetical protein
MTEEKTNAKQFPKVFYARHMLPGLAGYNDETILVDTDAVKSMTASGVGKPVYIGHQDVNLETIKEDAAGYIADSFFNELDGWGWFKFIAIDDKVYEAIANGWAVSNAYVPQEWGSGGTLNNCPYNRRIVGAEYTHLAVVPDPRYEGACILTPDEFKIYQSEKKSQLDELRNSKSKTQSKGTTIMKFFKRTKEEVNAVDDETLVEIKNDKGETVEISVKEMADAVLNAKKNEDDKEKEKNNDNLEVLVGDETMPLSELVNRYNAMKKNAEDSDEDKEKENESDDEDEEKDNESDEDKDEKKNSSTAKDKKKNFEELRNAHRAPGGVFTIETSSDKLARGKERYGRVN